MYFFRLLSQVGCGARLQFLDVRQHDGRHRLPPDARLLYHLHLRHTNCEVINLLLGKECGKARHCSGNGDKFCTRTVSKFTEKTKRNWTFCARVNAQPCFASVVESD